MTGLKEKSISGVKWSALGQFVGLGSEFIIGIILARLLIPSEFGVVAVLSVFINLANVFINSGFSQSLIRDQNANQVDYSTIFYFNLFVGVIAYISLFIGAPFISNFYEEPLMINYLRVLGLGMIINALTLVQRAQLTKNMNFKILNVFSVSSSIFSGIIAVILALSGFGIWSLISKTILTALFVSFAFWFYNKWIPDLVFSWTSFKKHLKYGSNLLFSGLFSQFHKNIFSLTIGKVFSIEILGFYNRGEMFRNIVSKNIDSVVSGVSFPALAKIQHDKFAFVNGVKKLLNMSFLIVGTLMAILIIISKPLIILLLGEKWLPVVPILQHLCIVSFFSPINSGLINSISVTGRSDLYLYFQIWGFSLNLIGLALGAYLGIFVMLKFLILAALLSSVIVSYMFSKLYQFNMLDLWKSLYRKIILICMLLVLLLSVSKILTQTNETIQIVTLTLIGLVITHSYLLFIKDSEYKLIKDQFKSTILAKFK